MAHDKVYAICENMCLEETMTKEQIEKAKETYFKTSNDTVEALTSQIAFNSGWGAPAKSEVFQLQLDSKNIECYKDNNSTDFYSYVKVSAMIRVQFMQDGNPYIRILKNGQPLDSDYYGYIGVSAKANTYDCLVIPPIIVPIQPKDKLSIQFSATSTDDKILRGSYLTVEETIKEPFEE